MFGLDLEKINGAVSQIDGFIKMVTDRVASMENQLNSSLAAIANLQASIGSIPENLTRNAAEISEMLKYVRDSQAQNLHLLETAVSHILQVSGENPRAAEMAQPEQPALFSPSPISGLPAADAADSAAMEAGNVAQMSRHWSITGVQPKE